MQRNADIGVISKPRMPGSGGFSGVMVRGSGVAVGSAQERSPMTCYDRARFRRPVIGKNGDCYDRYLWSAWTRCGSRSASWSQCVDAAEFAGGSKGRSSSAGRQGGARRSRAQMKSSMEALIHHFKLYTEGLQGAGRRGLCLRSKPRKASSASTWSADGTNKPYRCKVRAPGFAHSGAPWTS